MLNPGRSCTKKLPDWSRAIWCHKMRWLARATTTHFPAGVSPTFIRASRRSMGNQQGIFEGKGLSPEPGGSWPTGPWGRLGGNPGANSWFLWSTPIQMLPPGGSICGRLTRDLPLGCLQGEEAAKHLIENRIGRFFRNRLRHVQRGALARTRSEEGEGAQGGGGARCEEGERAGGGGGHASGGRRPCAALMGEISGSCGLGVIP